MPTPLPVLKIIPEAFVFLWNKKTRFLTAMCSPAIILFCIIILGVLFVFFLTKVGSFEFPFFIGLIIFLISTIIVSAPYVLFAIICHRLVLIGNEGVPKFGLRTWARREWWFLAYVILLPLVYLLTTAVLSPLIIGLSKEFQINFKTYQTVFGEIDVSQGLNYLILITATYFFSRLCLLLPATAVDRDVDVDWAWQISKGNGWRLMIVVGVLPWVFSYLKDFLIREDATIVEILFFILISFILLAVEIVALSLSYKHLTENEVIEAKEEGVTV